MRRLAAIFAAAFLLVAPAARAADAWTFSRFDAELEIRADGTVRVDETIGADFLEPRHGIFRYLPVEGVDTDGNEYRLSVKLLGATMDGEPVPVAASKSEGNVVWKIGEPDRTLQGAHAYRLSYEVRGAIGRFEDHDELYWNVTGDKWEVPLPVATAKALLPKEAAGEALRTRCFVGAHGSASEDCVIVTSGAMTGFASKTPGQPLTIVLGWPKGLVGEDRLGAFLDALKTWWPLALPILAFAVMYRRWRKFGDDAANGAVVAQYEPPFGMTPAETLAVEAQASSPKALAPTVIDLATRGYVSIEEIPKEGLGAVFGGKDYLLKSEKPRAEWANLKPFERQLLEDVFEGDTTVERKLSDLKDRFYRKTEAFSKGAMAQVVADGHFEGDPMKVRGGYLGAAGAFVLVGWFLWGASFVLGISLMACAAAIGGFGWFMPRWSAKGLAAAGHAKGYREFIGKVEKYRAPWMETQNVFEKTLPYALAFGLGAKWTEAFSGLLAQPPAWYHGASMASWNPASFAKDLDGWSDRFNAVAVSRPSSKGSGSGFGGGGFSGGGFGGGGGGSW